jgi:hypothetical protein
VAGYMGHSLQTLFSTYAHVSKTFGVARVLTRRLRFALPERTSRSMELPPRCLMSWVRMTGDGPLTRKPRVSGAF